MGQSAQCYVVRHRYYRVSDDQQEIQGKGEVSIWGIHDQWLYGTLMTYATIRCIRGIRANFSRDSNWLSLYELLAGNHPLDKTMPQFMHAMYGMDRHGRYCFIHDLPMNTDPTRQGNNEGISVIDMRNPLDIKYGFMGTDRDSGFGTMFQPVNIEQYLRMHYPADPDAEWKKLHRSIENPSQKQLQQQRLYVGRTERTISDHIKALSGFNVLTQEEVFKIFYSVSPYVRRLAYRTRRKQRGLVITPLADSQRGRARRAVTV